MDSFPEIRDGFHFHCTQCADCCTGDQVVRLNLFDLYKMGRFLRLSNSGMLFKKNLVVLLKEQDRPVWRPMIRFKQFPFRFCPFLSNEILEDGTLRGWCQLHLKHKPLVCLLAPVGCRYDAQNKKTDFLLVPPTEHCPGMNGSQYHALHTVIEPVKEEIEWQNQFFDLLEILAHQERPFSFFQEFYNFSLNDPFPTILNSRRELLQQVEPTENG